MEQPGQYRASPHQRADCRAELLGREAEDWWRSRPWRRQLDRPGDGRDKCWDAHGRRQLDTKWCGQRNTVRWGIGRAMIVAALAMAAHWAMMRPPGKGVAFGKGREEYLILHLP